MERKSKESDIDARIVFAIFIFRKFIQVKYDDNRKKRAEHRSDATMLE